MSATPDADCIAVFGQSCSALTVAQKEEVAAKTASAQAANYTNHSDYETASAQGYTLSAADGTQWTNAKSPGARGSDTTTNAQWDSDCDNSFSSSGGCDGLTKTQFTTIDSGSTGRAPALTAGYSSYDDWQSASALNYTMSAVDATLWGEANDGSVSSAACDAEFAGKACNELTKASFQNAKDSNALMTAKIAKVTAGTLNNQDLTDLSISFASSSLSSPVSAWQLDYLETVLGTTSSTTKANWQSTIDNYSTSAASKWYVYKIATSSDTSGTYATSNATSALLDACGLTVSSANSALGIATNAQISGHIRHANSDLTSLTGAPTDTQLNDFLTEAVGYGNGTSYSDFSTATTSNGWSAADYKTATTSGGWTSSSGDSTKFSSCKSSTNSSTGGASSCSTTKSEWEGIAAAIAAAADSSTDMTASDFTNVLSALSVTSHSFFDSSDTVMMGYLNNCISGESDPVDAVANCVSSGTGGSGGITEAVLKKNVTAFKFGKAAATNSGSYTTSSITSTDLLNLGVASHERTVLAANICGTSSNSSCLGVMKTALASASLTADSTSTAVEAWIHSTMRSHFENTVAANQSAPASPSSSGDACEASNTNNEVTLPIPSSCLHSSWTCTFQSKSPSGITLDLADGNAKLAVPSGGPVNNVSYTIRQSLNYTGGSYYKDFSYSLDIAASSNASANVQLTTHTISSDRAVGPWNHCINKGVNWELAESSEVDTATKNAASGSKTYAKANTDEYSVPSCSSSWGNNNRITSWWTWRNNSSSAYRAKYRNSSDQIVQTNCGSNSNISNIRFWCRNDSQYSCD